MRLAIFEAASGTVFSPPLAYGRKGPHRGFHSRLAHGVPRSSGCFTVILQAGTPTRKLEGQLDLSKSRVQSSVVFCHRSFRIGCSLPFATSGSARKSCLFGELSYKNPRANTCCRPTPKRRRGAGSELMVCGRIPDHVWGFKLRGVDVRQSWKRVEFRGVYDSV